MAPVVVVMSKLTRLVRESSVVNIPVADVPSSNVTPDRLNMWSARASTAPRARASAAVARKAPPTRASDPCANLSCQASVKGAIPRAGGTAWPRRATIVRHIPTCRPRRCNGLPWRSCPGVAKRHHCPLAAGPRRVADIAFRIVPMLMRQSGMSGLRTDRPSRIPIKDRPG